MAEDPKPGQEPGGTPAPPPPAGDEYWQKEAKEHAKEAQKLRERLKAIEDEKQKEAEAAALKRGEFESLYRTEADKAKALEAEVLGYRAAQQAELDVLLKDLSDEAKALVSDEALPLVKRLALARHLIGKASPGNPPPPGPGGKRVTSAEHGGYANDIEWARKDYEGYKKHRDSLSRP